MRFWNRFIRRMYGTLAEDGGQGHGAVCQLYNRAFDNGLFSINELDQLSLTLIVLACPLDNPLRKSAYRTLVAPGRPPDQPLRLYWPSFELLRQELVVDFESWIRTALSTEDGRRRRIVFELLCLSFGPRLVRFLEVRCLRDFDLGDVSAYLDTLQLQEIAAADEDLLTRLKCSRNFSGQRQMLGLIRSRFGRSTLPAKNGIFSTAVFPG